MVNLCLTPFPQQERKMGDTANLNLTVVIGTPGVCGDKKVSAEYRHVTARDTWPRTDISTDITTLYDLWTHRCVYSAKGNCAESCTRSI
jgi:hypothetical protein